MHIERLKRFAIKRSMLGQALNGDGLIIRFQDMPVNARVVRVYVDESFDGVIIVCEHEMFPVYTETDPIPFSPGLTNFTIGGGSLTIANALAILNAAGDLLDTCVERGIQDEVILEKLKALHSAFPPFVNAPAEPGQTPEGA